MKRLNFLYAALLLTLAGLQTACCSREQSVEEQFVTSISLSQPTLELALGESQTLSWTAYPSDATNSAVTWTSSNPSVVSVSEDGTLTALDFGSSTITCVAQDGSGVKAECIVMVNKENVTAKGVTFKMIAVEGGTFQMGSEDGFFDNVKPVHQVTLSSFFIGETEVTQELWQAVMGSNPSRFKGGKLPVEQVSWNDCQTFITKLNQLTGKTFRLPTEAEWEYAARGGNKSKGYTYSGSNTAGDVAWCWENSDGTTHEVATKAPNELGIYDMTGNVWEWCQDWYGLYSSDSQTNPTGPSSGSRRVDRGDAWNSSAAAIRIANRGHSEPTDWWYFIGLRLAY